MLSLCYTHLCIFITLTAGAVFIFLTMSAGLSSNEPPAHPHPPSFWPSASKKVHQNQATRPFRSALPQKNSIAGGATATLLVEVITAVRRLCGEFSFSILTVGPRTFFTQPWSKINRLNLSKHEHVVIKKPKQFSYLARISLIIWEATHHFATTAKLSNWLSSNERVPMATQPFFGVRTTAFSHSWYPFSCPDAYWPFRRENESSVVMMSRKRLHLHYQSVI